MSRTFKDAKAAKLRHWQSVFTPSWWNRTRRRRQRHRAAQAMRNGQEPQPRYGDDLYW